jgi:hypothetical protein
VKLTTWSALTLAGFAMVILVTGCGGNGNNGEMIGPVMLPVVSSTTTVQASSTVLLTATVTNDPTNKGVTGSVSCSAPPLRHCFTDNVGERRDSK